MTRAVVRVKAIIATGLMTLAAAGCSTSHLVAGRPTAANPGTPVALPQAELLPHFFAEPDPMHVLKEGLYSLIRQPMASSVVIQGYTSQLLGPGISGEGSSHSQSTYPRRREGAGVSQRRVLVLGPFDGGALVQRDQAVCPAMELASRSLERAQHQSPGGWAVFLTKDQLMLLRNPMPS